MKAYRVNRGIAPLMLHLDTNWRWVVNFTTRMLYPRGKSYWHPLNMNHPKQTNQTIHPRRAYNWNHLNNCTSIHSRMYRNTISTIIILNGRNPQNSINTKSGWTPMILKLWILRFHTKLEFVCRPQSKVRCFVEKSLSPVRNLEFMLSPLYDKRSYAAYTASICLLDCASCY